MGIAENPILKVLEKDERPAADPAEDLKGFEPAPQPKPKAPSFMGALGPGLITGASDDDPSGIATYSQAGAQLGYSLGWTLFLTWPLMCAIQEISARIGRVTGRGLAGNLKKHFPIWILYVLVTLLLVANTINLGADLGAMGAALKLLIPGNQVFYAAGFGALCLILEVFVRYDRYASVLKWLTLSLFAYFGVLAFSNVSWGAVAMSVLVPKLSFKPEYLTVVVAVLGTTISPYLFFRQSGLLTGCAKLLVDLGDTLRRSASRLTSSMTGSAPAPVPTTSQRHFHGISSSSESGV